MLDRKFYASCAASLAAAVCLHLFFFSRNFYSISWDESGRILDAHAWAVHGIFQAPAWLPFYRFVVGLGLMVYPDLILTPRLISFLFGLASIPASGWLAHELFGNRRATVLTLIFGALFSQRVTLSLAPLSDIMFIFLTLVMMALLARWLRTHKKPVLLSCAVVGALMSTLRYEGWLFGAAAFLTAVVSSLFAANRDRHRDHLLFGAILFIFPTLWALGTFMKVNPAAVVAADARHFSMREILRKNPAIEFTHTSLMTMNFLGVFAIIRFIRIGTVRDRAVIAASFGPLLLVSLALLLMRSAQTGPSWRMIAVWNMLLLPYTAFLLTERRWLSSKGLKGGRALGAIATTLVLGAFVYDTFRIEKASRWAFPESDIQTGRYLEDAINSNPETKVLIESSRYFYLNVLVASQHPDAFVRNSIPNAESEPVLRTTSPTWIALKEQGIRFLVFQTRPYKDLLNRSPDISRLKDFGPWSIYKVN
jgi:hypothetical protein